LGETFGKMIGAILAVFFIIRMMTDTG
jgi:hypothetical protein